MPPPYAVPADLIQRYDTRLIRQYASDTGTPILEAAITTDAKVLAALNDASNAVVEATVIGNHYTIEELDAIYASASYKFSLVRLVTTLAMGYLVFRRTQSWDQVRKIVADYEEAEVKLEMLRESKRIFYVETVRNAGVTVELVDLAPNQRINSLVVVAGRYFGELTSTETDNLN